MPQFLATFSASPLRRLSPTNTSPMYHLHDGAHTHISIRSSASAQIKNSLTDGLVAAVHRIGHHGHRIRSRYSYIKTAGDVRKFNAREELLRGIINVVRQIIFHFFVRLHAVWSHKSENISRRVTSLLTTSICNCTFKNLSYSELPV